MTGPPLTISTGGDLVYLDGYLYTPRGGGENTFYRYDIATNTWVTRANLPAALNGETEMDTDGTYIYLSVQSATTILRRYDPVANTWIIRANLPSASQFGGVVYVSTEDLFYVFRAYNLYDMWKYNQNTNTFIGLTKSSVTLGTGSDMFYHSGYLYVLRGAGTQTLNRLNLSTNVWEARANSPSGVTFAEDTSGVKVGNTFYILRGSNTQQFYSYNIDTNTWATLSNTPAGLTMHYGSSLAYPGTGDFIYATRGNLTTVFLRYSISGNSWSAAAVADLPAGYPASWGSRLASDGTYIYFLTGGGNNRLLRYHIVNDSWEVVGKLPFSPYFGTDMVYDSGRLIALAGYYKDEFWEYSIASNTWRKLPSLSGYYAYNLGPYNGASIATDDSGTFYMSYGNNLQDLRTFTFGTDNYEVSGTWTSPVRHLGYVNSWTQFSAVDTTPGDSGITYQTRTSVDGETWDAWQTVVGGTIASTPQSYIQVRALLYASSDGTVSPLVSSITVDYVGDTTAPTNPTTINAYSQQINGEELINGQSYRYTAPYFSWSGASDNTAVSGYYVYFGQNEFADPEVSGSFTTSTTYGVTMPLSTGTYYLLIKTKDAAGNISSTESLFEYDYNGISPPQSEVATDSTSFLGTPINVSTQNDQIKLDARTGGFWLESELMLPPATISVGARSFAYVEDTNTLYIFRGTGQTFYSYNLNTNVWSTLQNTPAAVGAGSAVIEGPPGYLYGLRGNTTTDFWLYDIAANTWDASGAANTPLTVGAGSSLVFDGEQFIYVLRGTNDDDFWRYNTVNNTWDSLPPANFGAPADAFDNLVSTGGDLAIDIASGKIFAIQGNYKAGFAVFNTNTNAWTVLGNLPDLPFAGASIEYDPGTNSVYYIPGNNTEYLYVYDVGNEVWTRKANAPHIFGDGAALRVVDGTMYAVQASNLSGFYEYDIAKDSWKLPSRGLFASVYRGTVVGNQAHVGNGADIVKGDGTNFYLIRGSFSDDFIRYNETTGQVTRLARLPGGASIGSSLAYNNTDNKIYFIGNQYDQRFYSYSIANNTWEEITTDPPLATMLSGASLVYDGSRYMYLTRGGATVNFYRYDTQAAAGSRWSSLANSSLPTADVGHLIHKGNYLYILRGSNIENNPLLRYDISTNSWTSSLSPMSVSVSSGGFLADSGADSLFAARGLDTRSMYTYSIAGNDWQAMKNSPANISIGGAAETNRNSKLFLLPGTGTNAYADALYTYIMETPTSGFVESGEYVSQAHDLGDTYKWASLDVTYTKPTNTNVVISTRSSVDGVDWSSWAAVSGEKKVGDLHTYRINSPIRQYLQVKYELSSLHGEASPVISDYTIHFYRDTTEPSNPTNAGLSAYANNTPGAPIVSNNWYGHANPHFTWPQAEATNGASDTATGSGVAGYYVYFGTDATANPVQEGVLITENAYTASNLVSGQTYYLRVVTVDDAGNVATDVWAPFIYKFDNLPPSQPSSLSSDPSGYTAINSFNFSWAEVLDNGEPVQEYCYKTGANSGIYSVDQCTSNLSVTGVPSYKVGANTFFVRSRDIAGNFSAYATVQYYYVDSANAPAPPTSLQVTPSSNTQNSFAFSWSPPSPGTYYGSLANLSYRFAINVPNGILTQANTTPTAATSLVAGPYATKPGENVFYIVTKDEAGNIDYTNYSTVSFIANTVAPGIPLDVEIGDLSVKQTQSWRIGLSWDPPASSDEVASYSIYRSTDGTTFEKISNSTNPSYVDTRLTQQIYYYKVNACDTTNNCGAFSDVVSLFPDGRYTEAPELTSEPVATDITTKKATISWTTARTADSRIAYGTSPGNYFDTEISNSEQVTFRKLTIPNLTPGTTYYYVARWTDEDGNQGVSDEYSFTTSPPPTTQEPKVKSQGLDSALIEFTSRNAQRVRIYYGETAAFGAIEDIVTGAAEGTHTVLLKNLTDGTKYFYKINSFDVDGEEYEGETHSFTTLPRPKLTNIKINQVRGTAQSTLLVTWESNTAVSSVVTYYPLIAPGAAKDEVNLALKAGSHQMVITGLLPQTTYVVLVRGRDSAGNEAVGELQQVATSADTRPPVISDLKVDAEVLGTGQEATVQLLVSYVTDEPATAQIEYGEGSGDAYSMKTQEDSNLTINHLIIVSGLQPGKVYHLRAVSKDEFGNKAESLDKVVITPKASDNALDLVINNLSSIFGFLRR